MFGEFKTKKKAILGVIILSFFFLFFFFWINIFKYQVSALAQVTSFSGLLEEGGQERLKNELNSHLPEEIRIWQVRVMTKSFQVSFFF